MLNRHKVFQQLQKSVPEFFSHTDQELIIAREIWDKLCSDPSFVSAVLTGQSQWPVPVVPEQLNSMFEVTPQLHPYHVISTDGSQIYPDRHQGVNCYLLNIGTAELIYNTEKSSTQFSSEPQLFTQDLDAHEQTPELIDCQRTELEFQAGLEAMQRARAQNSDGPLLWLCDGSLIFWHLENKEPDIKQKFLGSYLTVLNKLYKEKLLCAGYISMPKSKELVNIIRAADPLILSLSKDVAGQRLNQTTAFDHICDTDVAHFYLPVNSRTGFFGNQSTITQLYPAHLKPHFFYLRLPDEIVRVEIPAWIAQDPQAVNTVSSIILDQAQKGFGYPVALAEAHEQAVVKTIDREIFYQLVYQVIQAQKRPYQVSQKSLKKRLVGI